MEPPDRAELALGNRQFAFDFYHAVQGEYENLFYSPHSLSQAIAMAYGGARNQTERQMAETLHFTMPQERLHPAFNVLEIELAGHDSEGFRLDIANATWGQAGFDFLPGYLDLLAENYGAGLRLLDFENNPESARLTINGWVSDQTEDKIKDLLPEGSVIDLTRLVLTNAIYFKAKWAFPFPPSNTADGTFHLLDGSTVTAWMMSNRTDYRAAEREGHVAVELPYQGSQVVMLILVPDAGRFEEFESKLSPELLSEVLGALQPGDTQVTLPKFSFETTFDLGQALAGMGMPDAFSEGRADFSGINGQDCPSGDPGCLFIQYVAHKAFVAVDEEGTEASAATGIVVGDVSMPRLITVDRPFIFVIYDHGTETILFVGRVLNPNA